MCVCVEGRGRGAAYVPIRIGMLAVGTHVEFEFVLLYNANILAGGCGGRRHGIDCGRQ